MTGPAELLRDFVNTYDVESDVDDLASPAELTVWLRERDLIQDTDRAADDDLVLAVRLREGLREALRRNHDATPYEIGEGLEAALAALPLRVTLVGGVPTLEPAAYVRRGAEGLSRTPGPSGAPGDAGTEGVTETPATPGAAPGMPGAQDAVRSSDRPDTADFPGPHDATSSAPGPSGAGAASSEGGARAGLARVAAAIHAAHAEGMWPRLKVCAESTCQWAFIDSSKNRSRSWCSMRVCGNRTKTRAYRARRQTDGSSRVS
ncbi:CGNR zinc finger domain-containing protein [Microtetraspora fusca]|uniref:CGNR zinc finger domain-containing protein n=1 Tax=Microtetraspora fusca TaxID=1997 RepID=A0ABW6V6H0_MICFU